MALQQLTLPGEIVKKHNNLVRSKINIGSKTASRILACLIASIRQDDTQFKTAYVIPIKSYLPDDTGKSYQLAKDACKELLKATVESEEPDPDNPNNDPIWSGATFFTNIKYHKGKVIAEFNPKLSELLLQLRGVFTQYNLVDYLSLPSIYSQRLFEILKSWANVPSGEVILPITELHHMLDTPPSCQADFKSFRVRIIEKAYKDICEKTSFYFEWYPVKAGRSVEAIKFSFGPGRRAIAETEKKKAKEEKQRRLARSRWQRAFACAQTKQGICTTQDNKPIICKACMKYKFCEALINKNTI